MSNTVIMVSSIPNYAPDNSFLSLGGVERVYVQGWGPAITCDAVYFRAGYENEFNSLSLGIALQIEEHYKKAGTRIINAPSKSLFCHRKDVWYGREIFGITPKCLPSPSLEECLAHSILIGTRFPVILRVADSSGGVDTYLCHDERELKEAHHVLRGKRTLLVEFVEDKIGSFYGILLAYVVGGEVFCYHRSINDSWVGHRTDRKHMKGAGQEDYERENKNFVLTDDLRSLLLKPAKALHLQTYSMEILLGAEGPRVIDVNPMALHLLDTEEATPFRKGLMKRIHDVVLDENAVRSSE